MLHWGRFEYAYSQLQKKLLLLYGDWAGGIIERKSKWRKKIRNNLTLRKLAEEMRTVKSSWWKRRALTTTILRFWQRKMTILWCTCNKHCWLYIYMSNLMQDNHKVNVRALISEVSELKHFIQHPNLTPSIILYRHLWILQSWSRWRSAAPLSLYLGLQPASSWAFCHHFGTQCLTSRSLRRRKYYRVLVVMSLASGAPLPQQSLPISSYPCLSTWLLPLDCWGSLGWWQPNIAANAARRDSVEGLHSCSHLHSLE